MDVLSKVTHILDIPPSAIAFCPSHPELFVVGTYFLHPSTGDQDAIQEDGTQKRTGSLMLWRLEGTDVTLVETTLIESAVLDLEWTPHTSSLDDTLCIATSTGSLLFYALAGPQGKLVRTSEKRIADSATLVLDLLWHPQRPDIIAVTLSDGNVSLCESAGGARPWDEESMLQVREVARHELEPWTLAFSPDTSIIFSGGDDAVLQAIEITTEDDEAQDESAASMKWTDRRTHQAGVTSILPLTSQLVVSGSYDDHIRLLYAPPVGRRQVLAELNLGGGVWRTKMLASSYDIGEEGERSDRSYTILASCMHAGSRVVRLSCRSSSGETEAGPEVQWGFEVLARFEEHESMNYGSDVQPLGAGKGGEGMRTVVSTSFYDKRLCVWQVDVPGKWA